MKFLRREKALFATPLVALVFALVPGQIRNILFAQMPDRIVIENIDPVAVAKLRLTYKGHPDGVVWVENVPAHAQQWRLFNHRWLVASPPHWSKEKMLWIRVEGIGAGGGHFGATDFYPVHIPERLRGQPLQLVVHTGAKTGAWWWAEFRPSSRAQNESFWRDLGDALFRRPQQIIR